MYLSNFKQFLKGLKVSINTRRKILKRVKELGEKQFEEGRQHTRLVDSIREFNSRPLRHRNWSNKKLDLR